MDGVPPSWAIVLSILTLLFGGTGGVVWMIRKEQREARKAPGDVEAQNLANQRVAREITAMLREEQKEAMAEMRTLLADTRVEAQQARAESKLLRVKVDELEAALQTARDAADKFRNRVEQLLRANGIDLPAWWWHETNRS